MKKYHDYCKYDLPLCKVFYDKMRDSQQEIKSTVTVNTSDMAAKAHEDKEQNKELDKLSKRKGKLTLLKVM